MKIKFNYAPGQRVKDTLTGVIGIISSSIYTSPGYTQFGVQPYSEKGDAMPDAWLIDENRFEVLGGGLDNEKVFEVDFKYELGEVLKHISGVEGILVKVSYYLNGCKHCIVQPVSGKKTKVPKQFSSNEDHFTSIKKAEKKIEEEKEPPRGPSERVKNEKL